LRDSGEFYKEVRIKIDYDNGILRNVLVVAALSVSENERNVREKSIFEKRP
jgi:hypothetical protein